MPSYLIENCDRSLRGRLEAAAVPFHIWTDEGVRASILIDESHFQKALEALNSTAQFTPSEYQDVMLAFFNPREVVTQLSGKSPANDRQRQNSRALYIQACRSRLDAILQTARQVVELARPQILTAQKSFVEALRFSEYQSFNPEDLANKITGEYEALKDNPRLQSFLVSGNNLCLYTDTLYARCESERTAHEIGEFLIVINLGGGTIPIRWFNRTRTVDGAAPEMHAPYVYSSGLPVTQKILETLLELLARFELATATELAIQFVETIDNDPAGRFVKNWPRATV